MIDSVIMGTGNSRFMKSAIPQDITHSEMVELLRAGNFPFDLNGLHAPGWDILGTPLNKATLLPDSVCDVLGIDRVTSTVAEALLAIPSVLGKSLLYVTALHIDGSPYANLKINGITGIAASRCYTDSTGKLALYVSEGTYTLSSGEAGMVVDADMPTQTVTITAGTARNVTLREVAKSARALTITSSQNLKFSPNVAEVDVFCVGGGGNGARGVSYLDTNYPGGGGGGGYTNTALKVVPVALRTYTATVGAGGGGTTSFLGVTASGGQRGQARHNTQGTSVYEDDVIENSGGDGGSGGGAGGPFQSPYTGYGVGGTDGADGTGYGFTSVNMGQHGEGGKGQGRTTRAFGEASGALFSKGGDGAPCNPTDRIPQSGAPNTGNGGDGAQTWGTPGTGGSGIIMIRWRNKR